MGDVFSNTHLQIGIIHGTEDIRFHSSNTSPVCNKCNLDYLQHLLADEIWGTRDREIGTYSYSMFWWTDATMVAYFMGGSSLTSQPE